jgi:hypothetical protein
LNPNQFNQTPFLAVPDLKFNYNTLPVLVDVTQSGPLYPGAAVKMVNNLYGVPSVIGCAANSDECIGFINYNMKNIVFNAGDPCEISQAGNVLFLYATGSVTRGFQVQLDLSTNGGVAQSVGSSGANLVGWAVDASGAPGTLIRVKLSTPSFAFA